MTDSGTFDALREQLEAAARSMARDAGHFAEVLRGLVDDVARAAREPLEIFPVCHHSPASAVHLVRRLHQARPKVIYMECCEDLQPVLSGLGECTLPVALQAFASQTEGFPADWAPLSLVCPLTEFSAEFQAIAYCQSHPETELVFVDRSADHFFLWKKGAKTAVSEDQEAEDDEADAALHVHPGSVGMEIGTSLPTYGEFVETLIRNARVAHYSEWWDQYVEEAVIAADYDRYREVFFLVGSLVRRLGRRDSDVAEDELRERYMWTRMKQHLEARKLAASEALYICGAAHSASHVAEFGAESPVLWDIPAPTATQWLYGLLPSSYAAIERQFGHPAGSVSLAENRWQRQLKKLGLKPFKISAKAASTKPLALVAASNTAPGHGDLGTFLQTPPPPIAEDQELLLQWCVRIVSSARKHGYMASTADSIAIYEHATLLAHLRNRAHPTPWDFRDAAVTCLEKGVVPKRRSIARLCDTLLGGDRIGKIGYDSMPPLARDVFDRLKCLPIQLEARNIQRALLDFSKNPEWLAASDLLWKLRRMLPKEVVRPIIGQRELGLPTPRQESWDLALGRYQGSIIQLGYEGLTIEFVLEQRLRRSAFSEQAKTADALAAAEDCLLFLKSERLASEIGLQARNLLTSELDVSDAAEIYRRISRLVNYYRSFSTLPDWCAQFITSGYSHYCTLLPGAFGDRSVKPQDLTAILQFILTLESLALSLGCERSQFVIAIRQSEVTTTDPVKQALLWTVECVLRLRSVSSLREKFDQLLVNPMALGTLPQWLHGFLLSLSFTELLGGFTVELMSKAFAYLPDEILMPWLPSLLMSLRPHAHAGGALGTLLKTAAGLFPGNLAALANWQAPWERTASAPAAKPKAADSAPALALLKQHPASLNAWAASQGLDLVWTEESDVATEEPEVSGLQLLQRFPATSEAWRRVLLP